MLKSVKKRCGKTFETYSFFFINTLEKDKKRLFHGVSGYVVQYFTLETMIKYLKTINKKHIVLLYKGKRDSVNYEGVTTAPEFN